MKCGRRCRWASIHDAGAGRIAHGSTRLQNEDRKLEIAHYLKPADGDPNLITQRMLCDIAMSSRFEIERRVLDESIMAQVYREFPEAPDAVHYVGILLNEFPHC